MVCCSEDSSVDDSSFHLSAAGREFEPQQGAELPVEDNIAR